MESAGGVVGRPPAHWRTLPLEVRRRHVAPAREDDGADRRLGLRNAQLITNSSDLEAWAEPQLAYNRTLTFRDGSGAAMPTLRASSARSWSSPTGPTPRRRHGLFGLMERKQGTCRNVAVAFGWAA